MRIAHYDKKYNTKTIRATFLMFLMMMDSRVMDFDLFKDYTGLKYITYWRVRKIISEMIIDLNIRCSYVVSKSYIEIKKTSYISRKYSIETSNPIDYSYTIVPNLDYKKRIDYSMTILYLMLKNEEEVTYDKLATLFPLFTRNRFETLLYYFRMLIDEELYIENKAYKLREYDYE